MASENGVQVEDEERGLIEVIKEEGSVVDTKENGSVNKGDEEVVSMENVDSGTVIEEKQTVGTSPLGTTKAVESNKSKSKPRNSGKVSVNSGSKSSLKTAAKDQTNVKGSSLIGRKPRPTLTQSLSFPARVSAKSVDGGSIIKSGAKNSIQTNGAKSESKFFNRTVSSVKAASTVANSKGEGKNSGAVNGRRTTLASVPSQASSVTAKSASTNGTKTKKAAPPEELINQNPKSIKTSILAKVDEDARSATSSNYTAGGHRKTGAATGFSSRLEERAEKRKEFFTKLEEKTQAMEEEKGNLQAKSKESQEAEIRRLRKSLTFKATPMPTFYKEPPPRVELKKIPTTRARSPKLGRNKTSAANNENGDSCLSPKVIDEQSKSPKISLANGNKGGPALKKPLKRSQSRVQSHESLVTKTEPKPEEKTKSDHAESEDGKSREEIPKEVVLNSIEHEEQMDIKKTPAEDNGPALSPPKPVLEVTVEG